MLPVIMELLPQEIIGFDVKNTRRLRELLVRGPASTADRAELKYDVKILGITVDAEGLQGRIIIRTKEMLNQGFVQEVESLLRAYSATSPGLKSTGYSQVVSWLEEGGHDMAA
jgi:tRNA dimethylallyltransferase